MIKRSSLILLLHVDLEKVTSPGDGTLTWWRRDASLVVVENLSRFLMEARSRNCLTTLEGTGLRRRT